MRGFGYLISVISVIMLGIVALPKPGEPDWQLPVVLGGMAASIAGMLLRWLASRKQRAEIHDLERTTGSR